MGGKKIIIIAAIILATAGIVFGAFLFLSPRAVPIKSSEFFVHKILKIEGSVLHVQGTFEVSNAPLDLRTTKDAEITIADGTIITKTTRQFPTDNYLLADGRWDMTKIKEIARTVKFDELKKDWNEFPELQSNIVIKSDKNIYGKKRFIASELKYFIESF